jgi:hypothetical protein
MVPCRALQVRRGAVKLLVALCRAYPEALAGASASDAPPPAIGNGGLYDAVAGDLVARVRAEREDSVRGDALLALAGLVRQAGGRMPVLA